MSNQLISVLMPVYNAEDYIIPAVNSILSQTHSNFELIIIDDGSSDRSAVLLKEIKDQRVNIYTHAVNKGLVASLNYGLSLCNGQFIARMDADDIAEPARLASQLKYLQTTATDICGTWIKHLGGKNRLLKYPADDNSIKASLLFYNPIVHPSIMFRRRLIDDKLFCYSSDWKHVEDYELWIRLLSHVNFGNIPEPLLQYRISEKSVCAIHHPEQVIKSRELRRSLLRRLIDVDSIPKTTLDWMDSPSMRIAEGEEVNILNLVRSIYSANEEKKLFDRDALGSCLLEQFSKLYWFNKHLKLNYYWKLARHFRKLQVASLSRLLYSSLKSTIN